MAIQLPLAGLPPAQPVRPVICPGPLETLWDFPHCPTGTLNCHAKSIGLAGELLVDSILTRFGLTSLALPETSSSDRLLLIGDHVVRLQIKAASRPDNGAYRFSITRGYRPAPSGVRGYAVGDFHLLALVALAENVVMFTTSLRVRQSIPLSAIAALRARPRDTLEEALRALNMPIPGEPEGRA